MFVPGLRISAFQRAGFATEESRFRPSALVKDAKAPLGLNSRPAVPLAILAVGSPAWEEARAAKHSTKVLHDIECTEEGNQLGDVVASQGANTHMNMWAARCFFI